MKSIDNLRDYVLTAPSICSTTRAILVGYVDEIEREVKELTDERDLLKTQWEAGVDFDQRLAAAAEGRADVTLFGVDYTALPEDADGVPIHVGDKVTCARSVWEVTGLRLTGAAWGVCCTIFNDHGGSGTNVYPPCDLRHHREPTVEDVLREFVERLDEIGSEDDCAGEAEQECRACIRRDIAAAYAEYAAKLRLAGDE